MSAHRTPEVSWNTPGACAIVPAPVQPEAPRAVLPMDRFVRLTWLSSNCAVFVSTTDSTGRMACTQEGSSAASRFPESAWLSLAGGSFFRSLLRIQFGKPVGCFHRKSRFALFAGRIVLIIHDQCRRTARRWRRYVRFRLNHSGSGPVSFWEAGASETTSKSSLCCFCFLRSIYVCLQLGQPAGCFCRRIACGLGLAAEYIRRRPGASARIFLPDSTAIPEHFPPEAEAGVSGVDPKLDSQSGTDSAPPAGVPGSGGIDFCLS